MKKLSILTLSFLLFATLALNAQGYYLGQVITNPDGSQGVVFYLNEEGTDGWMVALHDASNYCPWGPTGAIAGLNNVSVTNDYLTTTLRDLDGFDHTQKIRTHCESIGYTGPYAAGMVDFENGWYLPSAGQLKWLYVNAIFYEPVLQSVGETMGLNAYWSSSVKSDGEAWIVHFGAPYPTTNWAWNGYFKSMDKTGYYDNYGLNYAVRAIRNLNSSTQPLPFIGQISAPAVICDGGPLGLVTPSLYNVDSYGWEIAENQLFTNAIPYTGQDLDVTYNGWYLRLWATNENGTSYSNAVRISIATTSTSHVTVLSCDPYEWNGHIYNESGVYQAILVNQGGCDSIVTLDLTIGHTDEYFIPYPVYTCEPYQWGDMTITESGVYQQVFANQQGCDSIVTLCLFFSQSIEYQLTETACNAYDWNGQLYSESGTYQQIFPIANGCDSIVTLNLTVQTSPGTVSEISGLTEIFVSTDSLERAYEYHIDSVDFATNYEWSLVGSDWTIEADGIQCTLWANSAGNATLTVRAWNDCDYSEQQIAIHAGFFAVDDQTVVPMSLYPNPAKDKVIVESSNIQKIRLFNLQGQLLQEWLGNGNDRMEIALQPFAASVYFVEVTTEKGCARLKLNVSR